jgi:hypothetical protein
MNTWPVKPAQCRAIAKNNFRNHRIWDGLPLANRSPVILRDLCDLRGDLPVRYRPERKQRSALEPAITGVTDLRAAKSVPAVPVSPISNFAGFAVGKAEAT